jgi:2-oxoglutarate dehydrogenase E1 component
MTPKSLLRHADATSRLHELATGMFQRVIADPLEAGVPERILLCSGKIFFELQAQRKKSDRADVPIVRIEQLYPFPEEQLRVALQRFPEGTPLIWVQEEPVNMGAWRFLRVNFGEKLWGRFPLSVVSRPESASPATGSAASHKQEQEQLLAAALPGTRMNAT